MIAPTILEKQADGTYKRVPNTVTVENVIADKEEKLLEIYAEIEKLKEQL